MLSGERLLICHPSREHVLEMLSKRFVVSALFAHAKRLENVNYSSNGGFIAVTFLVHCQFLFCPVYDYFPTRIFNDIDCFVKICIENSVRFPQILSTSPSNNANQLHYHYSRLIYRWQFRTYYFTTIN